MTKHALLPALLAAAVWAPAAQAASYLFTVNLFDNAGALAPAYSFTIDSDPTPARYEDTPGFSYFEIDGVTLTAAPGYTPAPATPADLLFFDQVTGGAFSTSDFVTISYFGTQLFEKGVDAPHFLTGTSDIYDYLTGDLTGSITIAEATSAVPEPAGWALMLGGFGLVGAAMRRRVSVRFA